MENSMIAQEVRKKVETVKVLQILTYNEFNNFNTEEKQAVAKELSNLFKKGILRRVAKGMYYKPSYSRFGELSPTDTDLLIKYIELTKDKIGYLSGTNIYRRMGLTTQLSKEFVIMNDTKKGILNMQDIHIKFVKSPIILKENLPNEDIKLLQILDALLDIKNIPACTPSNAVTIILYLVKNLQKEEKQKLYFFSLSYKPMVRALLGLIFNTISEIELSESIKKTLNPLTKFQVGLENNLLLKEWNII